MKQFIKIYLFIFFITTNTLLSATFGPKSMFTSESGGIKRSQKEIYEQNNFSTFEGLGGRSALGFNFATLLYGLSTKPLFTTIGDIIEPYPDELGIEVGERGETVFGTAFSFYYDFAITDYFTIGTEIGASELGGDFIIIDAKIGTFFWSANTKFFPAGNAPVGFYLQPKIGGTHININGIYFNGSPFIMQSFGIYASIELGWRITLFPRNLEEAHNRITLDISVIDIGYYFIPWNKGIYSIVDAFGVIELDRYRKASSMRLLPFPKIGISFTF